jgi:hypothetical protein
MHEEARAPPFAHAGSFPRFIISSDAPRKKLNQFYFNFMLALPKSFADFFLIIKASPFACENLIDIM